MLVDNTDATAADAPGCGVQPVAPCFRVSFGVAQALAKAAGGAPPTVRVQGGGVPYRGDCVGAGISVSTGNSLVVVGLNTSRDGVLVGAPIIDCEGQGRAFTYEPTVAGDAGSR